MQDDDKSKDQLIRELVELRQRVARDEHHYHTLFEQSSDAVFIMDLQGVHLDVNQRAASMLGYTREELLALNFRDIVASTQHKHSEQILEMMLAGTHIPPYERTFRKKGGGEFPVEINVELVRDEMGKPLHIQSIVRDISERREAEARLEKQRELLRQIIDNNPNVVIVKDEQGRFVIANRTAEQQLGKTAEEMIGKTDLELHPVREEAEAYMRDDRQALESLETIFIPEEPVTYANGELHWHQAAKIPFTASDGARYVMAVGADITERKQAEQQRVDMAIQEDRLQLLEELISDLSHDIRTPITGIANLIYLLKRNPEQDKQPDYLARMEYQINHLTRLVEDILTMSQLDKGTRPAFVPIHINLLVEMVKTQFIDLLEEKNLVWNTDLDADLPPILGSELELCHALANLLMNAITYTPAGGSITLRTYQQGDDLALEIHDTGIGIEAEDLPRIFERFYRADSARNSNQGGTGLGLSIAGKIIELHAGSIAVHSTPGSGSVFSIQLPLPPH